MVKKSGIFMVVALLLMANIMTVNAVASDEEKSKKKVSAEQILEEREKLKAEIKAGLEKFKAKTEELNEAESDARGGFWSAPTSAEMKNISEIKQERYKIEKDVFDKLIVFFDKIINYPEVPAFDKAEIANRKLIVIETKMDSLRLELKSERKRSSVWYKNKKMIEELKEAIIKAEEKKTEAQKGYDGFKPELAQNERDKLEDRLKKARLRNSYLMRLSGIDDEKAREELRKEVENAFNLSILGI